MLYLVPSKMGCFEECWSPKQHIHYYCMARRFILNRSHLLCSIEEKLYTVLEKQMSIQALESVNTDHAIIFSIIGKADSVKFGYMVASH